MVTIMPNHRQRCWRYIATNTNYKSPFETCLSSCINRIPREFVMASVLITGSSRGLGLGLVRTLAARPTDDIRLILASARSKSAPLETAMRTIPWPRHLCAAGGSSPEERRRSCGGGGKCAGIPPGARHSDQQCVRVCWDCKSPSPNSMTILLTDDNVYSRGTVDWQ